MTSERKFPKALTGLIWVAATLVGLMVVAWIALAIVLPKDRVRAIVEREASRAVARDVRFGDASVGLFPPVRVTVRDLAIANPGGFDRGAMLRTAKLHLNLDVFALFSRRVVVRTLELDGPTVHLVMYEDGRTNFDDVGGKQDAAGQKPGGPSAAMDLSIQRLKVRGGELLIDDEKARRRTAIGIENDMSLALKGGDRVDFDGRTTLRDLAFGPVSTQRREDLNRSLAGIDWRIEHTGAFDGAAKRIAFERLALAFGKTSLAFSGRVDEPGPAPRVDLVAKGSNVQLGEVLAMLAAADARALNGISGSGDLAFDLRIQGTLGPGKLPGLDGTLTLKDARFRYPGAPAGVDGLAFGARFARDTVDVRNIVASVATKDGGTPVRGQLLVTSLAAPRVRFALQGDVDLAVIAPVLADQKTKLAGRANVDVRGAGPVKDPGAMALEGTARLSNVSVVSPELPKPVEKVQGELRFSGNRAEVRSLSASAGASSFTLNAAVERPLALMADPHPETGTPVPPAHVRFALQSEYLDLAELLPVTPGSPVLPNATGGGQVSIARLKQGKLDARAVEASIALTPGVLEVPAYTLESYGGTIAGRVRVDLTDTAKPVFAMSSRVTRVDADQILSTWTPVRGLLKGTLTSDIDLSAIGSTPADILPSLTAVGLAALAGGSLGPGPALEAVSGFTNIPALKQLGIKDGSFPFAIEQGRVRFREVRFDGPTGEWRVAGSVGFDGTLDYAVSATLPPDVAQRLGTAGALAAGALKDPEGRILFDLTVTGPAKSPRVAWDKDAMLSRLMGNASASLKEKGRDLGEQALDQLGDRGLGTPDTSLAEYEKRLRATADSLKKLKARDVLKNLFGSVKDTVR